jgi:type I restriction enzyme S subunit
MLDNIKLNIPSLSLQQEFAEKVEAIERQKALVQQSIDETHTMFDYTMDKYFG